MKVVELRSQMGSEEGGWIEVGSSVLLYPLKDDSLKLKFNERMNCPFQRFENESGVSVLVLAPS